MCVLYPICGIYFYFPTLWSILAVTFCRYCIFTLSHSNQIKNIKVTQGLWLCYIDFFSHYLLDSTEVLRLKIAKFLRADKEVGATGSIRSEIDLFLMTEDVECNIFHPNEHYPSWTYSSSPYWQSKTDYSSSLHWMVICC